MWVPSCYFKGPRYGDSPLQTNAAPISRRNTDCSAEPYGVLPLCTSFRRQSKHISAPQTFLFAFQCPCLQHAHHRLKRHPDTLSYGRVQRPLLLRSKPLCVRRPVSTSAETRNLIVLGTTLNCRDGSRAYSDTCRATCDYGPMPPYWTRTAFRRSALRPELFKTRPL